ncbi:zinc-binding dehydrogenase [Streptomyces sparsogenes]|uniref:Alcohol dehydrogenase n=1 Tax=Streptomyces sparsogenes DSM 40356 TaxID=1331668 RepID=A0A1R1SNY3_9ACTN|nr:zinc-binding dehydrogenase [Streptomyces sparsogenes]OMI39937.1 alcohol dehydrogenase [Streptomyces sparsogenes DSM 40356]
MACGEGAKPLDPGLLFASGAVVRPVATGSRARFTELFRAVEVHRARPVIERVFPFAEVPDAFRSVQSGGGLGKVVIGHR